MNKTLFLAGAMALALGVAASASAQYAYGTDANENLYVIDLSSGATTLVGNHGEFLESIAYDSTSGRLFGHDTNGTLFELSTVNGSVINSWSTGLGNVEGMDFSEPGNLWLTDFSSPMNMHRWNVGLQALDLQLDTQVATGSVRTMCFDQPSPPVGNALFYGDSPNYQTLYAFDGSNPAIALGNNSGGSVYGMDMFGNKLYGLGGSGEIYLINAGDGSMSIVGDTGDHFWLGMTTSAVPEPATMVDVGGALATLAARRRRK